MAITDEQLDLFERLLELQALGVDEPGYDVDLDGYAAERAEYLDKFEELMWDHFGLVGDANPLHVLRDLPRVNDPEPECYVASILPAYELRLELMAALRERG